MAAWLGFEEDEIFSFYVNFSLMHIFIFFLSSGDEIIWISWLCHAYEMYVVFADV